MQKFKITHEITLTKDNVNDNVNVNDGHRN